MTNYYDEAYINDKFTLLGSSKYNPIVKDNCDMCVDDYYMKEKTIELCECKYQSTTINGVMLKSKEKIDLLISGDLQNQLLSSTLSSSEFKIPTLGIYSACATFIEGIILASSMLKKNRNIIVTTSSHNLVSEKQFRFPVEYGALRKRVNTSTSSGSISILLSTKKSNIKVESSTIGFITKTNHKDTNDMGSAMAPSCAEVIHKHLSDTNRQADYYDLILTGDLGIYGFEIMKEYYKEAFGETINNVIDSGSIFYSEENIYAGSSGPLCIGLVLFDYIIPMKKYKKILVIGTGSLHSVSSSNLKVPIPSVSHAVSLEVKY